jgi:SAM-dependent methyltransferase
MVMVAGESHARARQLFDETADNYLRRSKGTVHNFSSLIFQRRISIVESFIRRLARPGGKVLDYGMGPAVFAKCCTACSMHYVGIDASPEMVERAAQAGLTNSEFVVGDLDSLHSYAKQMDLVIAIGLIDYLEDAAEGIAMLAASVKPGGSLILSFRNRYCLPGLLRDASKAMLRPVAGKSAWSRRKAFFADVHENSFDMAADLLPQLRSLGFSSLEVRYFNCSPAFFNFPVPKLVWHAWYAFDELFAHRRTRWLCSGGVVVAVNH